VTRAQTAINADERKHRWWEDSRILTIVAAPAGWVAVFRKSEHEGYDPEGTRLSEVAWIEPIVCFALVEVIEREEVSVTIDENGETEWESTGRTELDTSSAGGPARHNPHWPHTTVRPVWRDSAEGSFPGIDEIYRGGRGPHLILSPDEDPNDESVLERIKYG
jgi:hypothetical protein